ncbi:MAG: hypothetical protein ACRC2K_10085, partial [Clostridium sp.]
IYLNSIKGEKEIDLKNLIRIINQEDMYVSIMVGGCNRYIVCGEAEYEKAIGNITLDLLNNLNFLKNSDEYIVKIFTKFEFDLRDICYIEDGIRDYIDLNKKINIKQILDKEETEKIYYLIEGKTIKK